MRTALLALSLALPMAAQEAMPARIAFFVPDHVIESSVRGKKLFAELEVMKKTLGEKLQAKGSELQKLDQQIKSPGMGEDGRAKLQAELQKGETEFKRMQEDSQNEFNRVRERVAGQFNQEIRPIVDAVTKDWKLQAVFTYAPNMLAAADEAWLLSFSTEVAKRYDAKEGVAPATGKPSAVSAPGSTVSSAPKNPATKKK